MVIGTLVVTLSLALVASFFVDRQYVAEVSFVHVRSGEQVPGLDRLMDQLGGIGALVGLAAPVGDRAREEDLERLLSRTLLERFVSEYELMHVLFPDGDRDSGWSWNFPWSNGPPTVNDAVSLLQSDVLFLVPARNGGVDRLRVRWTEPQVAADWANELVRRLNALVRDQQKHDATVSLAFLTRTLDQVQSVESRNAISRLIERQLQVLMLSDSREDFSVRVIDAAVAPDYDDYSSPNLLLILVIAGLLGTSLAGALVAAKVIRRGAWN